VVAGGSSYSREEKGNKKRLSSRDSGGERLKTEGPRGGGYTGKKRGRGAGRAEGAERKAETGGGIKSNTTTWGVGENRGGTCSVLYRNSKRKNRELQALGKNRSVWQASTKRETCRKNTVAVTKP